MLYIYLVISILIGIINYEHYVKSEEGIDRWIILGVLIGMVIWPIIGIIDIIKFIRYKKQKEA